MPELLNLFLQLVDRAVQLLRTSARKMDHVRRVSSLGPNYFGFRPQLLRLFAQLRGLVKTEVDAGDAAHTLVAQIEGTLSLARNSQDPDTLSIGARSLRRYLESLTA